MLSLTEFVGLAWLAVFHTSGRYSKQFLMIEKDERFTLAERYVEETGVSVFLTGKAGTGKTTFLKEIVRQTSKRFAVVAPTGVAAINAAGVTIHSFFQLPLCPYLPDVKELVTEYQMPERMRSLRKEKVRILRTLDLLIIDEISMVRADILDAIDDVLRRYRRDDRPFGGVQLLMIGDIQQLPPVVKDSERPYMEQVYPSPFFFNSKALQRLPYITIELEKVYRQSEGEFLNILNEVRSGRPSDEALRKLNRRLDPGFVPPENQRWIRLTTHNAQSDSVNNSKMDALDGNERVFKAAVEGVFPENAYPADTDLRLKEGAQVMFIRNDTSGQSRYFNGKIATVTQVNPQLTVTDEAGVDILVEPEKWENLRYALNEERGEIEGIVEGTFEQIPLRPAWAVTVHKSQGLTFDRVIIDVGAAFSFGQVYVALSRCRTLEGIVLTTPVTRRCTFTNEEVTSFESRRGSAQEAKAKLPAMANEYFVSSLCSAFDLQQLRYLYNRVNRIYQVNLSNLYPDQAAGFKSVGDGIPASENKSGTFAGLRQLSDTAQKFQKQIRYIISGIQGSAPEDCPLLKERTLKACEYFLKELRPSARTASSLVLVEIDDKEVKKAFRKASEEFLAELGFRLSLYGMIRDSGFSVKAYHKLKTDSELSEKKTLKALARTFISPDESTGTKAPADPESGSDTYTGSRHPELVQALIDWRREKCQRDSVPAFVVLHQKTLLGIADTAPATKEELLSVKGFGKAKYETYGEEILNVVRTSIKS